MPVTLSPRDLVERLTWRYATKKFDPAKKIPADTWAALEQSLLLSPSSFGLQPWAFIVVNDRATREKLVAASWNQPQILAASHLVVFAIRKNLKAADAEKLIDRMVEVRKVPRESLEGYKGMMTGFLGNPPAGFKIDDWSARQVYIALGTFLTSCAALGVDACPMEGIQPADYDRILGLGKQGLGAVCVVTAGYRAADDGYAGLAKVRYPAEQVIQRV
jgi:nitroreductase